ncbi:HAMP domain-containing sensor histidine kinase [Leucobacter soli]
MRETAERVSAESLGERLPVAGNDDVAELTVTINDMLDRLDQGVEAQRRLLSDVGHELKTPLTIVRGNIELMDSTRPEDVEEVRDLALDELDRMNRLVQDLSDASALYGRQPLRLETVDIAELLDQIAKKATAIAGAEVSLVESATGTATLDPARITQAMLQLAQNAVTHGGGRIELGSRRTSDRIEFRVRDHGAGVADPVKEEIFERFHRARDASGRAGSGLGLSIVRLIAQAHHGDATAQDAEGGGALFVLTVPTADLRERKDTDGLDPDRR